jgi:hypothetical protein
MGLRKALSWYFPSRVFLTLVGLSSQHLLHRVPGGRFSAHAWLNLWGQWDTGWYLSIAERGYSKFTSGAPGSVGQANYAFFPLYPLLARGLAAALYLPVFVAGLILANACLIWASTILYETVEQEYGAATAGRALAFFFVFPSNFLCSAFLSESLYLLLVLLCFKSALQERWVRLALFGFLVGLTRPPAVCLAIPLLYEYLQRRTFKLRALGWQVVSIASVAVGPLIFLLFVRHLTGDSGAFFRTQAAWGRHTGNPLAILVGGLLGPDKNQRFSAFCAIAIGVVIVLGAGKVRPSYLLFAGSSLLLPLSSSVGSMPRFSAAIFPVWIALARLVQGRRAVAVACGCLAVTQCVLLVLWVNQFSVMA